ncbi:MAG: dihydroorotate dehydrogenase (quinone), partial [Sulfurovaceae bacterium]|nr:dihydroorotate dehydrogenase (quinone) [Sulfurovaceae bacterium]
MQLCSYQTAKKILFLLNPENAHGVINFCLRLAEKLPFLQSILSKMYVVSSPMLRQNIFGKTFENPVGLGAGFDKNSDHIETMKSLGFGFTEVGTITPLAQDGNPKPRLFRLIEEKSIQ